jgi:hypothetical protein
MDLGWPQRFGHAFGHGGPGFWPEGGPRGVWAAAHKA